MWPKANEDSHQWMKISNVELRPKEVDHHMAGADVLSRTTAKINRCSLRLTHNEKYTMAISDRGFASMDEEKQRRIASKGGRAAHAQGRAHEFTSEEARRAGRKRGNR